MCFVRLRNRAPCMCAVHCPILRTRYKPGSIPAVSRCLTTFCICGKVRGVLVSQSSGDIPSITPAAPGRQSFRHEHARKLGTFTKTCVISGMFTRLSRLSAEVFMDADSIEIGTSAAPASWPPAVLAPPLEA
eukprot:g6386.t1